MADISISGVTKKFGELTAVSNLSLDIANGEFVVLLGPTGAGKTTTLRLVAGLEKADQGKVLIDGVDMTGEPPSARDVTFVFQQYSLYPHMSVYDNMAFPLRSPARKLPPDEVEARVTDVARMLHIDHKLSNKATQLSGGEMQRVAIGRALVRRPAIYLMDEPLSSLDAKLRAELRLELKRIQRELGATILYVTHDQIEAMTMADRIGVIHDGELVQIGTPREIYEAPKDVYVAAKLGSPSINLLPRQVFAHAAMPDEVHTIGARTEHLLIDRALTSGPKGKVEWIEHLGDQNHLHISLQDHRLVTLVDPISDLKVGEQVGVELKNPLYFDKGGRRIVAANR
ncbi:ABC transporter ATP-binding protein [Hwanghaeella sp.]|uniref:ABC transporter ATP-binding protein n=1 Tax=Hwanghaeella sp. TaxID=2605943 RepID=UPI003CCC0E26